LLTYVVDDRDVRWILVVVSYVLAAGWLIANLRDRAPGLRLGFALLAIGWAMNVTVVVANHGMPVSRSALRAVGLPTDDEYISSGSLYKHVAMDSHTHLRFLGDTIPFTVGLNRAMSIGDVAMLLGAFVLVLAAMEPRRLRLAPVR
jgi:hypothetical protein